MTNQLKDGSFPYEYEPLLDRVPESKRQLLIRAGKSHKFTIPEDDLPR